MRSLIYEPVDAGNLGMIVRSATALGVEKVYVYDTQGILNKGNKSLSRFRKASMGAYSLIEVAIIEDSKNLQRFLAEYDGRKIATVCDTAGSSSLQDFVCQENDLVLIGNERFGLPKEIVDLKDVHRVSIPMCRGFNSLNIGCAFTVIAYEYLRQCAKERTSD